MGRRPNPLIAEFFDRGAKLNDHSNRYQYHCKACGEDFPKGRSDTLLAHVTKKCPAISQDDRLSAVLSMNGFNADGSGRPKYDGLLHSEPNRGPNRGLGSDFNFGPNPNTLPHPSIIPNQGKLDNIAQPQSQVQNAIWNPLETLAEASRQIEAHGKHDGHLQALPHDPTAEAVQSTLAAAITGIAASAPDGLVIQDQLGGNFNSAPNHEQKDVATQDQHDLTAEERIAQLLEPSESSSRTAVSVAAAATARLTTSLLDPQLLTEAAITEHMAQAAAQAASSDMMIDYHEPEKTPAANVSINNPESATNWGGMAYMADDIHAPASISDQTQRMNPILNKGGFRMDTLTNPFGSRLRHSRAKFDSDRRREVQEVRRIGACIRCRILRKNCSKGTPCNTCRKVLSPRVWRTGCIRTKLSEYIDLYSAGVQVVMTQKRINEYKASYSLENTGVTVQASHFPETGQTVTFQVLQGYSKGVDTETKTEEISVGIESPVVLLDSNKEDIPGKVEGYMRRILPEYIAREPSVHVRITLEVADQIARETNDELLKRSLELWGIVEMMDRERQWSMLIKYPVPELNEKWIKDDTESEAYSNICMQLTAAAERKASVASRNLLNAIQRNLQDGKTKLGFPMFLTIMLFLNCLEKTTWAFKAWDQENLRPKWPLERPPSDYTSQGHGLTELLRMLMVIRRALPTVIQNDFDEPIITEDENPVMLKYFQDLNVTPSYLASRCNVNNFQPADSRSLEFLFCSPFLLNIECPVDVQPSPHTTTPSSPHVANPSSQTEESAALLEEVATKQEPPTEGPFQDA
ncbi:hypothetical protein F5Y16DRAFT_322014 [Xylariaceae sp. FL0255]|nr:hypothetical protein F5Y16DRAFT_322014 [Xylariaceae sp. FL0255]